MQQAPACLVRSVHHHLCCAQLWEVGLDADGVPGVTHLTTLNGGHLTTVNCIRFSPTGVQQQLLCILSLRNATSCTSVFVRLTASTLNPPIEAAMCAGEQLASGADKGEVLLWRVDRSAVRGEETSWQRCACRQSRSRLLIVLVQR